MIKGQHNTQEIFDYKVIHACIKFYGAKYGDMFQDRSSLNST